jgi:NitT/TauT family transport system permease protein/sulfonate transport system permease protein
MSSADIAPSEGRPAASDYVAGRGWAARLIADGAVAAALLAWWLAARSLPEFVLPGPLRVGADLVTLFTRPSLLVHTAASSARVALSVALALALGGALAFLARAVPVTEGIVRGRILVFLNSFPSLGWAILAVIWFEISTFSVVFVQVAILVPFCLVNLGEGLAQIDEETLEMGRSFTRSRWRLLTRIVLPLLMPYLIAALRISYGIGWKIALVSELFGADTGLGYLMIQAETVSNATRVFATCFAIVVLFTLGEKLVIDPLARRFAPPS